MFFNVPFVDVAFFAGGGFPTNDVGVVLRLAALFSAFAAVAVAIGWWWDRRRWLIGASIFLGTHRHTLYHRLHQRHGLGHGFVARWLLAGATGRAARIATAYYYPRRDSILRISPDGDGLHRDSRVRVALVACRRDPSDRSSSSIDVTSFPRHLVDVGSCWRTRSAGEKMPWLMVYLALPMILLSGRFLGERLEFFDWRGLIFKRQWLIGCLLVRRSCWWSNVGQFALGVVRPCNPMG